MDCAGGLVANPIGADSDRQQVEQTYVAAIQERATAENPDSGPDGAGIRQDGVAYTVEARTVPQAVAFGGNNTSGPIETATAVNAHGGPHGRQVAIAFHQNQRGEVTVNETAGALNSGGGKPGQGYPAAFDGMAVRRLTPIEVERLQGYPDNYTRIPWRGKPAEQCPDDPRYRAIGNSWAIPVVAWIFGRIAIMTAHQHREAVS